MSTKGKNIGVEDFTEGVLGLSKLPKLRGEAERLRDRHDMLEGGEPYMCPKCGHTTREVEAVAGVNNVRCESCQHTAPADAFLAGERKLPPFDPLAGPDGERLNIMTFGEQFVELLGEFVDAREEYAYNRRGVGVLANPDDMKKAGDRLQVLLDKRFPRE